MTAAETPGKVWARQSSVGVLKWTALTSFALAGLGAVTGVVAARLLGPAGRGELAAVQLWPLMLASLAMLGMPEALTYFSARQAAPPQRLLATAAVIVTPAVVVAAAVGWFLLPTLLRAQPDEVVRLARIYLLMCPLFALFGLPHHPLRGLGRFAAWNVVRMLAPIAWLLTLCIGWAVGWRSVQEIVVATLGASVVAGLVVLVIVRREIGLSFHPAPGMARPMLRYGMPALLTTLPQTLNLRLDQILMSSILPPRQLGLYVVAVAWSSVSQPGVNALGLVLFPRVAATDEADRSATFARGVRLAIAPTIIVTIIALLVTPVAVALLFGSAFAPAAGAAAVLLIASAILNMNFVLAEGLRGIGRPKVPLIAEVVGLVITVLALAALLHPLGIIGAAVASVLGYGTVFITLTRYASHTTGLSLAAFLRPSRGELRATLRGIRGLVHRR